MPPPPPPSKSYLLVFDSDSSDEELEYEDFRIREPPAVVSPPSSPVRSYVEEPHAGSRRPHVINDEDEYDDDSNSSPMPTCDENNDNDSATKTTAKLSKNQKRNRRRRQKKKSKSENDDEHKPTVSFSTVSTKFFPRCFSGVAVPVDGGWPLGMEMEAFEYEEEVELEDFEAQKQEDLRQRWELIMEQKKPDEAVIEKMVIRPNKNSDDFLLETRQWDYRSGMKNPLFSILLEEQRQAIFLECSSGDEDKCPSSPQSSSKSRSVSYSEGSAPLSTSFTRRSRSNSFTESLSNGNDKHSKGSPSKGRARSNSVAAENFNETYDQVYVHHVRSELEQLRNERTKSGATGCNCRKLTVYLPPKDGSGGKKAQHRRLKPSKLTSELKKRGLYDAKAPREKLEKILHDAVEKEPCCRGDDCFCARNGIDCQSDACSCWHDSHVHKSSGAAPYLSVKEIQARCGNPRGMYTVDAYGIDNYRENVIQTVVCQPVGTMVM